jgi:hypothetical protein
MLICGLLGMVLCLRKPELAVAALLRFQVELDAMILGPLVSLPQELILFG